jgi:hypothetical protein
LDLRRSLPTAAQAVTRAESWLREQQVQGATEVLIVTGRGRGSADGVPVVRPAIAGLLSRLSGHGVVTGVQEHTAGSFVVSLAPFRESVRAAKRRAAPAPPPPPPAALRALPAALRDGLHELARRELDLLGLPHTESFMATEMERRFAALSALLPAGVDPEQALGAAIRAALDAE